MQDKLIHNILFKLVPCIIDCCVHYYIKNSLKRVDAVEIDY